MDENSAHCSRFTCTGERLKYFGFFDVNAMYCGCTGKLMPLTAGVLWLLEGLKFHKKLMLTAQQVSMAAMQWIYYLQAIDGQDSSGKYVQMHHAYHRGEHEIEGMKVDGYMFKDGKHVFYEFLGMFSVHQYILSILLLLAYYE